MRRESIYVARFTQTRQTEQFVVQPGILFDLLPPAGDFRFDPLLLGFSGQNVVLGIQELFVAAVRRRMPRTRFARQQDRLGRMPRIVVSAAQSAPVHNVVTQSPCQHTRIVVTRSRLRLVMRQQRRIHQIVGHCQSAVAGSPRCGPSTKKKIKIKRKFGQKQQNWLQFTSYWCIYGRESRRLPSADDWAHCRNKKSEWIDGDPIRLYWPDHQRLTRRCSAPPATRIRKLSPGSSIAICSTSISVVKNRREFISRCPFESPR